MTVVVVLTVLFFDLVLCPILKEGRKEKGRGKTLGQTRPGYSR
jgi:hypothetical protein